MLLTLMTNPPLGSCVSPPQPEKCFLPAANGATWLGASIHVGDAILSGEVRFQPKLLTKCKTLGMLDEILASGHLDWDVARKLRGDLQWLFSMTAGAPGACCPSPETFRSLVRMQSAVMTVCTDASFEANKLRLGWFSFLRGSRGLWGGTCVVPPEAIAGWKVHAQQIFMGETLAALAVPLLYVPLFRSTDVIWFVDNAIAVSAAVAGTSREDNVHEVALASLSAAVPGGSG